MSDIKKEPIRIIGRATEDYQKNNCMENILEVWKVHFPEMRLGQLIINAIGEEGLLFNMEDAPLVDKIIEFGKTHEASHSKSKQNDENNE